MVIKLPAVHEFTVHQMAKHLGVSAEEFLVDLITDAADRMKLAFLPPHQVTTVAGALILLSDHRYYVFRTTSSTELRNNLRLAVDGRKRHNRFEVDGITWLGESPFHVMMSAEADPRCTILFTHSMARTVLEQLEKMTEENAEVTG